MRNAASILKILLVVIVIGLIVTYTYYKTRDLIHGPIITIISPANGATVNNSLLEIIGEVKRIAYISLNDRQIFTDESGNFKEKLLLSPGYNIITIKASDKFDRDIEKTLEIIYLVPEKISPKILMPGIKPPNNEQSTSTENKSTNKLLN